MLTLDKKENWDELAGRLRGRFSKITESDVVFIEGRHDDMIEKIGLRLGRTKEDVQKLVDSMGLVE
jgi:uncharacterized protein YjbJ (UPF0337 family)